MGTRTFQALRIDPAQNPAVLDTATWDPEQAWQTVQTFDAPVWQAVQDAFERRGVLPDNAPCKMFPGSYTRDHEHDIGLVELPDHQQIFLEIGAQPHETQLGQPVGRKTLSRDVQIAMYPTDALLVDRFCRRLLPAKGPHALGATPRLGIGVRMSTAVWPGIWRAMAKYDFAANAIQNSLRELNMLADLLAGKPAQTNYLFSFGRIDEGHTGSTFEGLWVSGVLSALQRETQPRYGADADHIMVKRGSEGLSRAKRVIDAARYYTFFTLDVSDILNYQAIREPSTAVAETYLTEYLPEASLRRGVATYHTQPRRIGGQDYRPDRAALGRLVGKYWQALGATQELYDHLTHLKGDVPFDLELSIDETPAEISTCEALTQEQELLFLIVEIQRRQLPITHIAPNFGVEKGVDYRCPGGLTELAPRVRRLYQIASDAGLMLDCHSGDDLSSTTRKVFGRATQGNIHFKISPSLQVIFGETLNDLDPDAFQFWWDDTLAYARREAAGGAAIAIECLRAHEQSDHPVPSARTSLFQHFNFATVGRRDQHGQFLFRERFYDLPSAFYDEYARRIEALLGEVAADVFCGGE